MTLIEDRPRTLDLSADVGLNLVPAIEPELIWEPLPDPDQPEFVYYVTPPLTEPERGFIYDDPVTNKNLNIAARTLGLLGIGSDIIAYKPDDVTKTLKDDSGKRKVFKGLLIDFITVDDISSQEKLGLKIDHNDYKYVRDLIPESTLAVLGLGAQVNRASRNGQRLIIEETIGPEYYLG